MGGKEKLSSFLFLRSASSLCQISLVDSFFKGLNGNPVLFVEIMDLVLVPSRVEEAFGRISVEAIYRNKFVLVSGRGGLPETVDFNESLIVRAETVNEWRRRIDKIFLSGPMNCKCQSELFGKVSKFEIEKQVDALKSFLLVRLG